MALERFDALLMGAGQAARGEARVSDKMRLVSLGQFIRNVLYQLDALTRLSLDRTKVGDKGVKALAALPDLIDLKLHMTISLVESVMWG
jgi:hypothetical protein